MENYRVLLIDDDKEQGILLKEAAEELNSEDDFGINIICKIANDVKEAAHLLYTETFDGLIVDLTLNEGEEVNTDEKLSGNLFLDQVLAKEIIPVIVNSGTPERFVNKFETRNNIIKIYAKDEKSYYEHIIKLIDMSNSSIYKLFGSEGEIQQSISYLFWEVIPNCFASWQNELSLEVQDKDKVIIRYISSWLINKYNYSTDQYVNQDPLEMYMFPNNIQQVCTGDIFENNGEQFVVLTPSCDLANSKIDHILLSKIVPYNEITRFFDEFDKLKKIKEEGNTRSYDKKMNSIFKWFRNGNFPRVHFLPKVSFFEGGFIDFQQIKSEPFSSETLSISDENYQKLGVLTDSFVKDVISRFGRYYQRQGQPELNGIRVLEYLMEESKVELSNFNTD